ncbi:MAG: hypothetical protein ACFE9T_06870 [Promethearchaeota archaeon]
MSKCKICGTQIGVKNKDKVFQFTLGNTINGEFYGSKTIYFHVDCLNGKSRSDQEIIISFH